MGFAFVVLATSFCPPPKNKHSHHISRSFKKKIFLWFGQIIWHDVIAVAAVIWVCWAGRPANQQPTWPSTRRCRCCVMALATRPVSSTSVQHMQFLVFFHMLLRCFVVVDDFYGIKCTYIYCMYVYVLTYICIENI